MSSRTNADIAAGGREWPLLMSGPLVLASLKGLKTVTRRVPVARWKNLKVGDRLWVRETWMPLGVVPGEGMQYDYRADFDPEINAEENPDCVRRLTGFKLSESFPVLDIFRSGKLVGRCFAAERETIEAVLSKALEVESS